MSKVEVLEEGADPREFSVRLTYVRRLQEEEEEVDTGLPLERIPLHTIEHSDLFAKEEKLPDSPETFESGEEDAPDTRTLIPSESSEVVLPGEQRRKSSIAGASFNFINSIIGAGIIGIPLALAQAGFVGGVVLLVLVALITDYTILLLIRSAIIAGKYSYQEMMTAAFGTPGYVILTLVQFFFPFFAMAGYVVITGDTFSRIITQLFRLSGHDPIPLLVDTRLIKVAVVVVVMLPLSLLRNIARLEKFSAFAILSVVFIVTVTVYEASHLYCAVRCFKPECCSSPVTSWVINKDIIQSVGIMAFAFVCHHNTYLIYASLRKRSLTRFTAVTHISVSTSFLFCIVLGLAGFLTFIQQTQGDLLNNYCVTDTVANVTRFFYALVIMLTYPIECFVTREVLEIALSKLPYKTISWIPVYTIRKAFDRFLYTPRHKSLPRHIVLTILLVAGTLAIGISTNDLGVLLAFNGCLMATPLAFIFPTASYLKLSRSHWRSRDKIVAILVLVFGVVVMVIGTALAIRQLVESYIHQENYHPQYCLDEYSSAEEACSFLLHSTRNLSLSVSLCDCSSLCSNTSLLNTIP